MTEIPGHGASGLPVILVHGSMDRGASFRRLAGRLTSRTVVTYDRRGYAGSLAAGPAPDFETQVDDLVEVIAGRPCLVFGHSYGGTIALGAAQRHPDLVTGLVVWEPAQPWLPVWAAGSAGATVLDRPDPADAAETFMRLMVGDPVWERLPARTRQARRAEGRALVAELAALRRGDPPFDAATIGVPVVCGHGSASRPHHIAGTQTLAGTLPKGEVVCVDGAAHGAHLSHPAAVAALVERVTCGASDPNSSYLPGGRTLQ